MSTLRHLFEEALAEDAKDDSEIKAFRMKKAGDGSFKGNPWHAGKTGRFTKFKREKEQTASFGVNTGSKYRRKGQTWDLVTKDCGSDGSTEDDPEGDPSGMTPNGSPQRSANVYSKGPSAKRGTCSANAFGGGKGVGTPEGRKQIQNLIKGKAAAGAGGRKAKKGAKQAAYYNPAFVEAQELFMARLMEGAETHPLEHVDYARNAIQEALQALISMPDAEDYDEIVESAEALAEIDEFLDYSDEG